MGYRRSKEKLEAARNWSIFVARKSRVVEAVGLQQVVTESINHWDDFLMHGYLDHHDDVTGFTVDQLSEAQYTALLQFVDSYFATGYEYFYAGSIGVKRIDEGLRCAIALDDGCVATISTCS